METSILISIEKAKTLEPISVVIPKDVAENLRAGVAEFCEHLKDKPDLIIVLQRAGSLVFPATVEAAKKENLDLPDVEQLNIGRSIRVRFEKYMRRIEPNFGDEYEPFDTPRLQDLFTKWLLEKDKKTNAIVAKLRETHPDARRIMVVDDTQVSGDTALITKAILAQAYGLGNVTIDNVLLIKDAYWLDKIISDSFHPKNNGELFYLEEVATGWRQDAHGGIIRITSKDDLAKIGKYTEAEESSGNPDKDFEEKYGVNELIGFHTSLVKALAQSVRKS